MLQLFRKVLREFLFQVVEHGFAVKKTCLERTSDVMSIFVQCAVKKAMRIIKFCAGPADVGFDVIETEGGIELFDTSGVVFFSHIVDDF